MALLLGLVLGRPVLFWAKGDVFNRRGSLVGADPALASVVYRDPSRPLRGKSYGWRSFFSCRAARARAVKGGLEMPFRCHRASGSEEQTDDGIDTPAAEPVDAAAPPREPSTPPWLLTLEDGTAAPLFSLLDGKWNRWTHQAKPYTPLARWFPDAPFMFASPSVINMYAADFVHADGALDATMRNTAASVAELLEGRTDLSGPRCLVRRLSSAVHESVWATLEQALRPALARSSADARETAALPGAAPRDDAMLIGLHVRLGDAAMQRECAGCVNGDDPDVTLGRERISREGLERELACVNRSIAAIADALRAARRPRRLFVFVASDTEYGMQRAKATLSAARVLSVVGRAVHSTRDGDGDGLGARRSASEPTPSDAALKVAADFVGLALAQVLFGIGDSSFLGNAAAAGLAEVARVSDRTPSGPACRTLEERELQRLVADAARQEDEVEEEQGGTRQRGLSMSSESSRSIIGGPAGGQQRHVEL